MSIPKCLITACGRPSAPSLNRGLCMACYSHAKKLVDQGNKTWDDLVALGLALGTSGNGGVDPFTTAFNEANGKNGGQQHASSE